MPSPPSAPGRCPIHIALDTLGDRWSLLIVRDLVFKGKRHYREFARSPEAISTNILADRLAKLDAQGIVSKTRDPANASRFIYRLTEKGLGLIPLLLDMTAWSTAHHPDPDAPDCVIEGAPDHLLRRLRTDRDALIREIEISAASPSSEQNP